MPVNRRSPAQALATNSFRNRSSTLADGALVSLGVSTFSLVTGAIFHDRNTCENTGEGTFDGLTGSTLHDHRHTLRAAVRAAAQCELA